MSSPPAAVPAFPTVPAVLVVLATAVAPTSTAPNVAVGFESDTGDLLATYAEGDNNIRYRTMPDAEAE